MEAPNANSFNLSIYDHVVKKIKDSDVTFNRVYFLFREKVKATPADMLIEFHKFFEEFLKRRNLEPKLIDYYAGIGRFEEARSRCTNSHPLASIQLTLHIGDYTKIEALEKRPEPDCSILHLSLWLKYHFIRRTILKAINGYSHNTYDGNGLIKLYLGDCTVAQKLFCGDALEGGEENVFKMFCALNCQNFVLAHQLFDIIQKKNISFLPYFHEFLIFQIINRSIPKEKLIQYYSTITSFNINTVAYLEEHVFKYQFIHKLAKTFPNPITKFYSIIRANFTNNIALRAFTQMQQGSRFNTVDQMVFEYYDLKADATFLREYGETRQRQSPHPFFLEMILRGRVLDDSTLRDESWFDETDRMICEYSKVADLDNIQYILGMAACYRDSHAEGLLHFSKHATLSGYNIINVVGIYNCFNKLGRTTDARTFILKRTKDIKVESVLELAEDALVESQDEDALLEFYKENVSHMREYEIKIIELVKMKNHREYEIHKDDDFKLLDSTVAIRVLTHQIDNLINASENLLLRSYHHYLLSDIAMATSDIQARLVLPVTLQELEVFLKLSPKFLRDIVIPNMPKEARLKLFLAAEVHFILEEYERALEYHKIILRNCDDYQLELKRIICFYFLKNFKMALFYLDDLLKIQPCLLLEDLKKEIEEGKAKAEAIPETVSESSKPKREPRKEAPKDMFKLEDRLLTDAKQFHLDRKVIDKGPKAETVTGHIGSRSIKGAVDPLIYNKRFNAADFKPRDDAPVEAPTAVVKPAPKSAPTPLFVTNLNAVQKERVSYAIERMQQLIQLEEQIDKGEFSPNLGSVLLLNNYLYTYLRVFGILSELAKPPVKDHLSNIRNDARHSFIVASLANCRALLNYLKLDAKLISQMDAWIKGGIINHLAVSPYSILDKEKNRIFEHLHPLDKDKNRIEFMKQELDHIKLLMEPIKTFDNFQKEDVHQNAVKMSIMMIGKSWSKMNPDQKKRLAVHFAKFNLEGNLVAHQFKDETERQNFIFKHCFEDISLEIMWKFAQEAMSLKEILEKEM